MTSVATTASTMPTTCHVTRKRIKNDVRDDHHHLSCPQHVMSSTNTSTTTSAATTTIYHVHKTPRHGHPHWQRPPPPVTRKHVENDHCNDHHHSPCPQHPTSPTNTSKTTTAMTTTTRHIHNIPCHPQTRQQWSLRPPPPLTMSATPHVTCKCIDDYVRSHHHPPNMPPHPKTNQWWLLRPPPLSKPTSMTTSAPTTTLQICHLTHHIVNMPCRTSVPMIIYMPAHHVAHTTHHHLQTHQLMAICIDDHISI